MNDEMKGLDTIIGLAAIGTPVIGMLSFIAAFFPLLSGDFAGAGMLLTASALSFGLLSVAVLGR